MINFLFYIIIILPKYGIIYIRTFFILYLYIGKRKENHLNLTISVFYK